MQLPKRRRIQRVHLAQPVVARLGTFPVLLVDISVIGARLEHQIPLAAGGAGRFTFRWEDEEFLTECRIVRSRLERFSVGPDGLTVYHSGIEFRNPSPQAMGILKRMIGGFISRALEEQKLNARGVLPEHLDRMPIFRHGGQLTSNPRDVAAAIGSSALPTSRLARDSGYMSYQFENKRWRMKRTHDPGQPLEGFTISADEGFGQAELLCEAYEKSDKQGRRMIQLFAQLSIMEGEGIRPGRFDP